MKKQTLYFWPTIRLRGIIVTGGIIIVLFLSLKFAQAQLDTLQFEFEGLDRNCYVFLPQNYQPNMPVVFNLHGYTYDAQMQMNYSRMNDVADTAGFIVIYPDAIEPGFNGGVWIPDPPHLDTTINDVGFISAMIDTIKVNYDIDTNRVYCCGLSNGGQMTYRLTCQLGHRFAAVASVSGLVSDNSTAGCLSYPPIPILHMHGTADNIVPYGGSTYQWGVEETLNFWLEKNGCSLPADTVYLPDLDPTDGCTVQKISYTDCEENSSLIFYKVIDGGHSWPGATDNYWWSNPTNQDINANVEIWNFFKDYPQTSCLPEGITFTTQEEIDNFQSNYPGCTEVEGDVTINGDDIANLNGLDILTAIGGDLVIGDTLNPPTANPLLTNLDGLESLTTLGGDLNIISNQALVSLTGLENLEQIEGSLIIGDAWFFSAWGNPSLASLSGLDNLTSIGGSLKILKNSSLTSIIGLNNLAYIEEDIIIENENLTSLSGLENITSVEGDIWLGYGGLGGNSSLTSLTGFDNLTSIGAGLYLYNNDSLTSLADLENLTSIGGTLTIGHVGSIGNMGNASLLNLNGLQNLNFVGAHLSINGNESLASLSGLEGLTFLGGTLGIANSQSLISLTALVNLTSVGGDLSVGGNSSLTRLSGLENITSISGNLSISLNSSLSSLSGLDSIDAESILNITITNNSSLYDCDIWPICQYLIDPGGTVVIENNAPECNSIEEVEEHCLTDIEEFASKEGLKIYPNPLGSDVIISYNLEHSSFVTLKILDLSGKEMSILINEVQKQGEQNIKYNSNGLKPGVYFCVLKTNPARAGQTKKIIKLD